MKKTIEELHEKAAAFHDKHGDEELREYLLGLARALEDADMLRHQFAYFLMQTQSTIAYQSRPRHYQDAIERAQRFLKRFTAERMNQETISLYRSLRDGDGDSASSVDAPTATTAIASRPEIETASSAAPSG